MYDIGFIIDRIVPVKSGHRITPPEMPDGYLPPISGFIIDLKFSR